MASGKVLVVAGLANGGVVNTAEFYDPASNTWSPAPNITFAREYHTATLLASGKVLITGGTNRTSLLANAELYDPAFNSWGTGGTITVARQGASATLLPNGHVLLVSGSNGTSPVNTVEQYDPGTNSWGGAHSYTYTRQNCTAALLPNGKLLVAGGTDGMGQTITSAEMYDPASDTWSGAGTLNSPRSDATATMLPSGRLLVVAGNSGGVLNSVEIYDLTSGGAWTLAASMGNARGVHASSLLPSGKVLVAGGDNGANSSINSAEVYDPITNTWNVTGNMTTARGYHTMTLLTNGKVLVAGGRLATVSNILNTTEIFNPANGVWTAMAPMGTQRANHVAVLLPNGKVLVAGGSDSTSTDLNSVEIYDPVANTWAVTGSLTNARSACTVTLLPNGKVLVAGGDRSGSPLSSAEIYDPGLGTWSQGGNLITGRSGFSATLLSNGKVVVTGGHNGTYLSSSELYDPQTNSWTSAASMIFPRERHTATLLPNGKVLAAGGQNGGSSAEIFDPVSNLWSVAGSLSTSQRYLHTTTLLSNGRVLVMGGAQSGVGYITSCELYDPGLGYTSASQPVITTPLSPVYLGSPLTLSGSGFKGISEASSGSTNNSSTNYPLVQLHSLVNDQVAFLLSSASSSFSDISFTSVPINNFPVGNALVTVFTNGIPSNSAIILIAAPTTPSITSSPAASGVVGTAFSFQVASNPPATAYSSSTLPAGLTLNGNTGVISGTPTTAATTPVNLTATTPNGNATATLTITIAPPAPVITSAATASGAVGTTFTFQVTTNLAASAFTASPLPGGITFNTSTGVFSGTPTTAATTSVNLTAATTNGTASGVLTITIAPPPPTITSPSSATGSVGTAFSYQIATNLTASAFTASALPAGLTLNTSTGVISGTPTAAGALSVSLTATTTNGTASATLTITISASVPAITSALTASSVQGQPFSYTITATGGVPITFAATPLPAGLSLSGGIISGTPTNSGVINVALAATNSVGSDNKTLVITINSAGAPSISSALQATGTVGQAFAYTITATGTAPITFTANGLPSGLSFSGGVISGTPAAAGTSQVTLTASGVGSDTKTLTITINASGAPTITSALTANAKIGVLFSYTITATGSGTVSLGATGLPSWMTLSNNVLSGTPVEPPGVVKVTLAATNSNGSDTKELDITVAPAISDPPVIDLITVSRVPARNDEPISFTAQGRSLSRQPLTYTWFFFSEANSFADGPPLPGNPVTRSFPTEGSYTAVVVAFDGFSKSAESKTIMVSLAPNPGTLAPNVFNAGAPTNTIVNPNNANLGIRISSSKGGALQFDSVPSTLSPAVAGERSAESYAFKVNGIVTDPNVIKAVNSAAKFLVQGINVVELDGVSGTTTRKARAMVPISKPEAGDSLAAADTRSTVEPLKFSITGRLSQSKMSSVQLMDVIEISQGLMLTDMTDIEFGLSSFHTKITIDTKGRVLGTPDDAHFSKIRVTMPKVDRLTHKTAKGATMTINFTLTGTGKDLVDNGLGTEGVEPIAHPARGAVQARSLQYAVIVAGMTYQSNLKVVFTPNADFGTISGRR